MNCMYKSLYLKKGKEESLRRWHPWIFSGAVGRVEGELQEGDCVRVMDSEGRFLCVGHWQVGSIAVRVLSFDDETVDLVFWERRLREAYEVRLALGLAGKEGNSIYRLVHGEGDNLPGLIVDMYGTTAVMQAHSVGMHCQRMEIAEALKSTMGDALKRIYYKSETTLPFKADVEREDGFIYGGREAADDVAEENGLRFHIDWLRGQKTGFFIDQRDNRRLVEQYARGRRVLNMFAYTGGFSVYALRGGAVQVHSVDSSAKAVDTLNANVRLSFPDDGRHEAFVCDAFKFLDGVQEGAYDLVILDPPAFAKHRDAVKQALRGYTKLNARAMEKMPRGSVLFTFSCSQAITKEQFRMAVFTAATLARRRVRILHQLTQAADHPVNIYHPEGEYLKGLALYID